MSYYGLRKKPQPIGVFDRPGHDMVLDGLRDQLAHLIHRSALEAWLASPATIRKLEDLRYSPSQRQEYARLLEDIETARAWAIDTAPAGDTA